VRDVRVAEFAGRQFNRVSRAQLNALGLTNDAIAHRVGTGRYVIVEEGVFAIAPVLEHDPWGRFMGAVLTDPGSFLGLTSAAAAFGFWDRRRDFETVIRPGNGGPRRHGGVVVYRGLLPEGDCTELRGIPITSVPRTLLDLAARVDRRALGRALRQALLLRVTSTEVVFDRAIAARGRRGSRRLLLSISRYLDLPAERARSWSELRAVELLREHGYPLPELNRRIAGEEADLSWAEYRQIVEIDGGPFHEDRGEDARKETCWRGDGWTVRRAPSEWVHHHPERFLALCPPPNVPDYRL
jgi:very-short-patch-repair endonuclease